MELKKQVVDDIRKTVIVFANTNSGAIYVEIEDDGKAVGVQNVDGEMLRLSNMIRDVIKPDVTLFTCYDLSAKELPQFPHLRELYEE